MSSFLGIDANVGTTIRILNIDKSVRIYINDEGFRIKDNKLYLGY